jgi:DNA-binding LacI/PurR family transcriptional regulator
LTASDCKGFHTGAATNDGDGGRHVASRAGAVGPGRAASSHSTAGDVASRAGVSEATVSRALRGLPNVAESTRARVRAAAAELHYQADPHASRLAEGRTRSIGVAMPLLGRWYFHLVLAGISSALAPSGYDMLVYSSATPEDRRLYLGDALPLRKRVDGLILVDMIVPEEQLRPWAASGINLVTAGQRTSSFPSVGIDDRSSSREAVRHLLDLGHRDLALIGAPVLDPAFQFTVPGDRYDGYCDALTERGVAVRPELIAAGHFSIEGGRAAMEHLLQGPVRPTAVFAASDEMAFGAMQTLRAHRLEVPRDISIVGFDDHDVAEPLGLTTIRQPVAALGTVAGELLLEHLADPHRPTARRVLETQLIVRSSTRPN